MMHDDEPGAGRMNRVLVGAGVALVLAAGGWWWWSQRGAAAPDQPPAVAEAQPPVAAADPDAPEPIENPMPPAPEDGAAPPLPPAAEADAPLGLELGQVFGTETVASLLEPQNVVRRLVATVDSLPRAHGADRLRPVRPLSPGFAVEREAPASVTADEHIYLSPQNAARYEPLVSLLASTDMQHVAALYQRWYPLLQQNYEELGYPGRYFNDRLVQVIDHLLEAPTVKGRIELTQPNVMFEFADPKLEALSAGHKLMIRMGPENAARVKTKLRELRAAVAHKAAEAQNAAAP